MDRTDHHCRPTLIQRRHQESATREKHDRKKKTFVPQNVRRRRGNEGEKKGKKELEGKSSNEEKTETTRTGCG